MFEQYVETQARQQEAEVTRIVRETGAEEEEAAERRDHGIVLGGVMLSQAAMLAALVMCDPMAHPVTSSAATML